MITRNIRTDLRLAGPVALAMSLAANCATATSHEGGAGGTPNLGGGSGGSSNSGGATGGSGGSSPGGASGSGGTIAAGGSGGVDTSISSGGSGGTSSTGGSIAGGGTSAKGGTSGSGGSTSSGGASASGGSTGTGGNADSGPPPITYALPPPNQLINQFNVPGCQPGVATSPGGGNCTPGQNACEGTKQGAQINFLCPRFMLFSDEMIQAAADDGNTGLNYAVVGHDLDYGGIDGNLPISCCQCYQLVYSLPEQEAQVGGNGASAIPIPPPLVVQAFNTSAGGGKNFDVFMAREDSALSMLAIRTFPRCQAHQANTSIPSFQRMANQAVAARMPLPRSPVARAPTILVTTATLSSTTCQANVATACGKFASRSSTVTSESINSCTQSNNPNTYYHINWQIYAKRVECPTHLTQVTGCKLAPQGLDPVDPAVTTAAQAAADSSFKSGYTTTTMQDCCMPTCAWQNNTKGQNLSTVGDYDSFYSCDQNGVPVTESN